MADAYDVAFDRLMASMWAQRVPLARMGCWVEDGGAVWRIAKAESDPWALNDLRSYAGAVLDSGEPFPPPLEAWARELAAGRWQHRPRTGPKGDPRRDMAVAHAVRALRREGLSLRAAWARIGAKLHLSARAARDAYERGKCASITAEINAQTGKE